MKLKFYLRGLGIGIVVTALLMGMAPSGEEGLTDAQIKERAAQLGMVDEGALTLDKKQNLQEQEALEATESTRAEKATESTQAEKATEIMENIEPTESMEAVEPTESKEDAETEPVLLTIQRGDNSSTVSKRLEEAGVITDAEAYDKYLCDNGYATVIRTGTYEIPSEGTEEEIAKIITGKE